MADLTSVLGEGLADPRLSTTTERFRALHKLGRPVAPLTEGEPTVVGTRVFRFLPRGVREDDVLPSVALIEPVAPGPKPHESPLTHARFGVTLDGRWITECDVEPGTSLYGTGMNAGSLERSGTRTCCWNTDFPAYTEANPSLYQSHPWVLGVRQDGSAFGVLADTTFRCEVDLAGVRRPAKEPLSPHGSPTSGGVVRFVADGTPHPVYIIEREHPAEVVRELARLTGRMPMPPRWALGYHQCRWSYKPQGRAIQIAREFRRRGIPCDCIWFDIHYMDRYRVFTFDPVTFADPDATNAALHEMGFKAVWMIDPAPAADPGYFVYDQAIDGGHCVLQQNGEPFVGEVWPGEAIFPDFTRPETRDWWADLYADFIARGIDGVWNDMNEPSNFNTESKTLPETCWHRGGGDLPAGTHAMYHNVYGMLMASASRDGIRAAAPDKRPFVLTRSNFVGGQRYAATWTGDNSATWDDLAWSITMCLNMGLSGQPFVGPDIGGFNDHSDGDPRLFARWMGVGCLLPFARGHVEQRGIDKEPWALGEECEHTSRRALERRYRLLPYLYTVFREAHTDGLPVVRPAFFMDPTDPELRTCEHAFLLGGDLLVVCDVSPDAPPHTAEVPRAARNWRAVDRYVDLEADKELPRLFLRPGAVLPIGPVMQFTSERPVDELTLLYAEDEDGVAVGRLYEDSGDGFGFERGEYRLAELRVDGGVLSERAEGSLGPPPSRAKTMLRV